MPTETYTEHSAVHIYQMRLRTIEFDHPLKRIQSIHIFFEMGHRQHWGGSSCEFSLKQREFSKERATKCIYWKFKCNFFLENHSNCVSDVHQSSL